MLAANTILQGRYRVVRQLGQGGMGTVYEAVDQRFESQVALKETHFTDESLRKQFEREARLLNKLRHPAMTRVIDHFTEGGGQFLVMDFVEGEDLWEMLQRRGGAFPLGQVARWGEQLLDALDYIHSQPQPIIHRDIKPQNLKLTERGQIILLDFGLAKGSAGQMTTVATSRSVLGYSLAYAPPEQILKVEQHWVDLLSVSNAEQVQEILRRGTDARSDLYSLGATLLHLLTGKTPPNAPTRALSVWSNRPDPLAAAFGNDVPERAAAVLKKSMGLMMDERYASAAEMLREWRGVEQEGARGNLDPTVPYTPPHTITAPPPKAGKAETVTRARTFASPPPPSRPTEPKAQQQPPPPPPAQELPPPPAVAAATKSKAPVYLTGLAVGLILLLVLVLNYSGSRGGGTSNSSYTTSTANSPASTPTPLAGVNLTSNNSSDAEDSGTVTVRLKVSIADAMGNDEIASGASATVVSSLGRENKEQGSSGYLEFEVPCGESIEILTFYPDGDSGLSYQKYVPCGKSVINLGYLRYAAA